MHDTDHMMSCDPPPAMLSEVTDLTRVHGGVAECFACVFRISWFWEERVLLFGNGAGVSGNVRPAKLHWTPSRACLVGLPGCLATVIKSPR